MSNFVVNTISGGLSPLFERGKGTINNRLENSGEQVLNRLKTGLANTAILGTAVGLTYGAHKSPAIQNGLIGGFKFIQKLMGKNKYTGKVAKVITDSLKFLPKNAKIGGILGAIALPLVAFVSANGIYKAGQIDQKYTDKAALYDSKGFMI